MKYQTALSVRDTQIARQKLMTYFEGRLMESLNVFKVMPPLVVTKESGLNDDLNGVERKVSFEMDGSELEIVQSLAKWKRHALKQYEFEVGEGIVTDMRAIRRDETLSDIHSIYVDQWDWEKIIPSSSRCIKMLKDTVEKIYDSIRLTEKYLYLHYPELGQVLPDQLTFITSEALEAMYPSKTPKEREYIIAKDFRAVFIIGIGERHDLRAPDYDDWSLNGDLIFYDTVRDEALEISSMGIRVDEEVLRKQLEAKSLEHKMDLPFHKALLEGEYPQTIGGGIGQSRLCMFLLRKHHIGEVQVSFWNSHSKASCSDRGISLL